MADQRVPLYDRLPGIYPVRDQEQNPPGQLAAYLGVVESVLGEVHRSIEQLYHDLFIETCDDWVVPYIGDLLGVSHLQGDPWTVRADVAGTIALRRRKGTLAGIERLTYNLTGWGVHAVELRDTLAWCQHLNHQRPDAGGRPPYAPHPGMNRFTLIRGGTVAVRDPAMLSLTDTPFNPWAHVVDVRPPEAGAVRRNLPNLGIFLWRLAAYSVPRVVPVALPVFVSGAAGDQAGWVVRVRTHPLGYPVRLFNVYQYDPERDPPVVTELDRVPGPMLRARLDDGSPAGNPSAYVGVEPYDPAVTTSPMELSEVGLQLHVPEPLFAGRLYPALPSAPGTWTMRGENLCAWESGVRPPLLAGDIAIDPQLGRTLIGVQTEAEANALAAALRVTYTYAAPGPVGAHPISRGKPPQGVPLRSVSLADGPAPLAAALADLPDQPAALVVQIEDSGTYELDLAALSGTQDEGGGPSLVLAHPLIIRAASGERPVILLEQPLRFRSVDPAAAEGVWVRLEGLYLTRTASFPVGPEAALVARTAIERLEVIGCTLDPGGHALPDGTRADLRSALWLEDDHGFDTAAEERAFDQLPRIVLQQSVAGGLRVERGYALTISDSIVDAGGPVGGADAWAIASATNAPTEWGPPLQFSGLTVFGRSRVESVSGRGGVFTQRFEALDDQRGCVRYSCFSGDFDRLPQNLGCVRATEAELLFSAVRHGDPAYARIAEGADFRIRERGPDDDAMGAYGFLHDAARLRNLRIRYREFMPVGIRPLLVPVT